MAFENPFVSPDHTTLSLNHTSSGRERGVVLLFILRHPVVCGIGLGAAVIPQQSEIMQIAFSLAVESILAPGKFNLEIAESSLRIFVGATAEKSEREAAEAVLAALDDLAILAREDRRTRVWQERKLVVQEAFTRLQSIRSKVGCEEQGSIKGH